jgi:hypothetical protein
MTMLNSMSDTMPWYRSRIILGAAVSILSKVLVATGVISDITTEEEAQLADLTVLLVGGIGDLVAITARVGQKAAPMITATK